MGIQETEAYEVDPATGDLVPKGSTAMGISANPDDRRQPETQEEMRKRLQAEILAEMGKAAQPTVARPRGRPRKDGTSGQAPEPDPQDPGPQPEPQSAPAVDPQEAMIAEKVRAAIAEAEAKQRAIDEANANPPAPVDPTPEPVSVDDEVERRVQAALAARAAATQAEVAPAAAPVPLSQQAASNGRAAGAPAVARTTAVAVPANMAALYAQDAGRGLNFAAEDLSIPRIYLLQDMSNQVKERDPDYVPGARPGMWFNTVTRSVYPGFRMIPLKYARRRVAWRPRNEDGSGGGLVRMDVPLAEFEGLEQIGIGVRGYQDEKGDVEVVETPEWIGYLLGSEFGELDMPVAVSFPKTKATAAGNINTILNMQRDVGPDGQEYELPCFASIIHVGSKVTGEGKVTYFVPNPSLAGRVEDTRLYLKMRKLRDNFEAGDIDVAPINPAEQG